MDPIPKEKLGNATSLFNVMRNIGGSVGIAVTGTILVRRRQTYTSIMSARVTAYDPAARAALEAARNLFVSRGSDTVTATQRATAAIFGNVVRQAGMVAFVGIFRLLGVMFLVLLPLLLLMTRPHGRPVPGPEA
jgi:DHA2 family multidrug resistance protein